MTNLVNKLSKFAKVIFVGAFSTTIKFKGKYYHIYEVDNENHSGYEIDCDNGNTVYYFTEDEVVEHFVGDE